MLSGPQPGALDYVLPATMDAHGNSLHADVEKASAAVLQKLAETVF